MRTKLVLFSIPLFLLASCKKDEQSIQPQSPLNLDDSNKNYIEIVATDAAGKNKAYYRIQSMDSMILKNYVENHDFIITTSNDQVFTQSLAKSAQTDTISNKMNYNLDKEPLLDIELICSSLEKNVNSFSLLVKDKPSIKKEYIMGYPVGYSTSNQFIGAVHLGWGEVFYARLAYTTSWWQKNFGSATYVTVNGANAWFIYPTGGYYLSMGSVWGTTYTRSVIIYPSQTQSTVNYRIAYSAGEFRGHNCSMGYYDGANCRIGAAPSGTTAFIYGGYFYYTPSKIGTKCPYSGSWYDGANCVVVKIASGAVPYIYGNSWYVQSDVLPN